MPPTPLLCSLLPKVRTGGAAVADAENVLCVQVVNQMQGAPYSLDPICGAAVANIVRRTRQLHAACQAGEGGEAPLEQTQTHVVVETSERTIDALCGEAKDSRSPENAQALANIVTMTSHSL